MTFEEWWERVPKDPFVEDSDRKDYEAIARAAWDAAKEKMTEANIDPIISDLLDKRDRLREEIRQIEAKIVTRYEDGHE